MTTNMCSPQPVQLDCRRIDCLHYKNEACKTEPQIIMIGENGRCQTFEVDFESLLADYDAANCKIYPGQIEKGRIAKAALIEAYNDAKSR